MPFHLTDLQSDERTCTVSYGDEMADVTYRPSGYTPEIEDKFRTALQSERSSTAIARLLSGMLVRWELLDEDGVEITPTFENLCKLPAAFLTSVLVQINSDSQAGDDAKNSVAGSRRKGSLGSARGGTR